MCCLSKSRNEESFAKALQNIFINIWFAIGRFNKYILYADWVSKGTQTTQSANEIKCTNEKMTCNTQDINLSWYVPKANVDHTVRGQGTSTLDHSATTPRVCCLISVLSLSVAFWLVITELSRLSGRGHPVSKDGDKFLVLYAWSM